MMMPSQEPFRNLGHQHAKKCQHKRSVKVGPYGKQVTRILGMQRFKKVVAAFAGTSAFGNDADLSCFHMVQEIRGH